MSLGINEQRLCQNSFLLGRWMLQSIGYDPLMSVRLVGTKIACSGSGDEEEQDHSPIDLTVHLNLEQVYLQDCQFVFLYGEEIGKHQKILIPIKTSINPIHQLAWSGTIIDCNIGEIGNIHGEHIQMLHNEFPITGNSLKTDWFARRNWLYVEINDSNDSEIRKILKNYQALKTPYGSSAFSCED